MYLLETRYCNCNIIVLMVASVICVGNVWDRGGSRTRLFVLSRGKGSAVLPDSVWETDRGCTESEREKDAYAAVIDYEIFGAVIVTHAYIYIHIYISYIIYVHHTYIPDAFSEISIIMYLGKIPIISTESFRQKRNNLLNRASYSLHAETIVSSLSRNFSPVKARSDKEKAAAIAAAVAGASIFPGTWDFPFSLSLSFFFLPVSAFIRRAIHMPPVIY